GVAGLAGPHRPLRGGAVHAGADRGAGPALAGGPVVTLRALLAVPGAVLVLLAIGDTLLTAIRVDQRGGPVTRWMTGLLWRLFPGGGSRRGSGPPPLTGVLITIAILLTWIVLAVA